MTHPTKTRSLSRHLVTIAMAVASVAACAGSSGPAEPVATTSSALTITNLFPTGVDGNGTPLATGTVDPHYTLTSNDPLFPGPHAVAVNAQTGMGGAASWTPNTPTSKWISIQTSAVSDLPLTYTYTTKFSIGTTDPTTVTLSGSLACDDTCVLRLNGTAIKTFPSPAWPQSSAFTIPAGGPFVMGTNTLAVMVTNSGGIVTGLQITSIGPGCTGDSQCASTQFCDTATSICVPKIPDGTIVPTITGHTPPLTGVCSAAVGTAVCVSGVCSMTTNDCGSNTTTTPACTMDSQCASGQFCDTQTMTCTSKLPDGAPIPTLTGHTPPLVGTCSTGVGAAVCVSGACSTTSNTCAMACTMDSQCASTQFCDTQAMACTPKLPNGSPVPTLTGHTPALTGTCSTAVGAAVCASAVCDMTNNECGYANGDGPCTAANGGTVCQSGVCASDGTCAPGATCTMDSDCSSAQFCNTQSGMCTAKLPNGVPIPNLTGHTPPLTAMCTPAAGAAVCISAVCDAIDNECGYVDGDGPCTTSDAAIVCQSGTCNAAGTCGPGMTCTTDSDCTDPSTPVCDPTLHLCVAAANDGGAGSGDASAGNSGDASSSNPRSGADGGEDLSGFAEGGGCAIARTASSRRGAPAGHSALALLGVALALGARRQRRRSAERD